MQTKYQLFTDAFVGEPPSNFIVETWEDGQKVREEDFEGSEIGLLVSFLYSHCKINMRPKDAVKMLRVLTSRTYSCQADLNPCQAEPAPMPYEVEMGLSNATDCLGLLIEQVKVSLEKI